MAKITNTSKKNHAVTLPNGVTLKPRESTEIATWDEQYGDAVMKAWRKAGIISVESEPAPAAAPAPLARRVAFNDAPTTP